MHVPDKKTPSQVKDKSPLDGRDPIGSFTLLSPICAHQCPKLCGSILHVNAWALTALTSQSFVVRACLAACLAPKQQLACMHPLQGLRAGIHNDYTDRT